MHDTLADLYIFLGDCKKQASQNYVTVSTNNPKGLGVEDMTGEPMAGDENNDYEKATEELQKVTRSTKILAFSIIYWFWIVGTE